MSWSASIDRRAETRFLARYHPAAVDHILGEAARVGAVGAARVMRGYAPVGTSDRQGQYYRRMGLGHGTFKKSVKAAKIRGRGSLIRGLQGRTIGYVIGPIGKTAFTRAWIEYGTSNERANPWVARSAAEALSTAQRASEAVLTLYADMS